MKIVFKFKLLFLFAITALIFSSVALLGQRDELLLQHQNYAQAALANNDARPALMLMLSESIKAAPKGANAADKHNYTSKYNTQLEHYAYIVAGLVEKNKNDDAVLKKIEQELALLEKTAQALGIDKLINQQLITSIKNSITYLRKLAFMKREKENKI